MGDVQGRPRVIVVGAGIAGCQVARELAPDHDVLVLDRRGVAVEATGLSAGLVAPPLFYGDLPEVAAFAIDGFRSFDGTHGFEFVERDRLDVIPFGESSDARESARRLKDAGFTTEFLDGEDVAEHYPRIDLDGYAGAVLYRDAGWVDPYTYATALKRDAEERGATVETGVCVTRVRVENGRVAGVETPSRSLDADAVVVAAGWRSADLLGSSVNLPVRPFRTQCLVLSPSRPLEVDAPLWRLGDEHLYGRPELNGDLLVGGAHETVPEPTAASSDIDESFALQVAETVPEIVRGFDDAGFVNGWAGVDVGTPDTRPIIDRPVGGPEGLVVATGFNGLGVMISPIVGPTVRQRLIGADPGFPVEPFAPDRFDDVGTDFEYVSTSEV